MYSVEVNPKRFVQLLGFTIYVKIHIGREPRYSLSQARKGNPRLLISHERHIREDMIQEWGGNNGEVGQIKQPNLKATPDFKEEVVRLVIEKGVSLNQAVLEHGLSKIALEYWVRSILADGHNNSSILAKES